LDETQGDPAKGWKGIRLDEQRIYYLKVPAIPAITANPESRQVAKKYYGEMILNYEHATRIVTWYGLEKKKQNYEGQSTDTGGFSI
jgi:hypothetical protein